MDDDLIGRGTIQFPEDDVCYPVNCHVERIRLSAHASGDQLEDLWRGLEPKILALVHGEEKMVLPHLKRIKRELGGEVVFPHRGEIFDL